MPAEFSVLKSWTSNDYVNCNLCCHLLVNCCKGTTITYCWFWRDDSFQEVHEECPKMRNMFVLFLAGFRLGWTLSVLLSSFWRSWGKASVWGHDALYAAAAAKVSIASAKVKQCAMWLSPHVTLDTIFIVNKKFEVYKAGRKTDSSHQPIPAQTFGHLLKLVSLCAFIYFLNSCPDCYLIACKMVCVSV